MQQLQQTVSMERRRRKLLAAEGADESFVVATRPREQVVGLIEDIVLRHSITLVKQEKTTLHIPNTTDWASIKYSPEKGHLTISNTAKKVAIDQESFRFKVIMKLLPRVHHMLLSNTVRTLRDIYYTDVPFFKNQDVVNDAFNDLVCLLRVPRWSLNCVAASKGQVIGKLRFKLYGGPWVDCHASQAIPSFGNEDEFELDADPTVQFVLVVEKDCTYQLIDDGFLENNSTIMVTGRGYPDVNSRLLVKRITDRLDVPVLCLVDCDPHGIEIAMCYKFGSRAMAFDAHDLAVPELRWLGLLPSDLDRFNIPLSARIPMNEATHKKATELISREVVEYHGAWRRELELLCSSGWTAELQAVSCVELNFLSAHFVPWKLQNSSWL